MSDYSILFEPLTVKGLTLRNRIVVPPMVSNRDLTGPDAVAWYGSFAAGGAGLVIVEAARIHRFGHELTAENLRPLVEAIHDHGAAAAIQLFFAPPDGRDTPAKLTLENLSTALQQFATAAQISLGAGFDGVEPHGAHGYLLNQFFSPLRNTRTDGYGGPLEHRMRLGLEVVSAVREAIGPEAVLLYRHTPVEEGSYDVLESLEFARRLVGAGVDVLDLSPSSREAPGDLAAPFKALGLAPVIAVGRLGEPARAREALAEGRCDLVAIGRGQIADPDWARKVERGDLDDLITCTECDQGCFGNLRMGKPVECVRH